MENSRFKFRAWDKQDKKMTGTFDFTNIKAYDGECHCIWFETSNGIDVEIGNDLGYGYENKSKEMCANYVLMQFTGLLDKQGVEIFNHDIVKVGNYAYIVEIDLLKGMFFRCIEHLSLRGGDIYYSEFVKDVLIEVIGNIYENSELLN